MSLPSASQSSGGEQSAESTADEIDRRSAELFDEPLDVLDERGEVGTADRITVPGSRQIGRDQLATLLADRTGQRFPGGGG